MVVMLLTVMVGCAAPAVEQEITYRPVSLGPISVSIPINLESSQQEPFGESYQDIPQGITLNAYDSTSGELELALVELHMKQVLES